MRACKRDVAADRFGGDDKMVTPEALGLRLQGISNTFALKIKSRISSFFQRHAPV